MRGLSLTLSLVLLAVVPAYAAAPPRGYQARACGFDLNHNGVPGEAVGDCDQLCHGSSAPISIDLDGNGVLDRQIFVNSATGNDANPGTSASPKRTIQAALNTLAPPAAPTPNQIQAVCFAGTFSETIQPTQSGAAGTYTRPQAGSEARSFEYSRYPMILSGWDLNGNGDYPPHDQADTAVLDGTTGSLDVAIDNATSPKQNLEFAHFSGTRYGYCVYPTDGGFMLPCSNASDACGHIYVHDLALTNISQNGCSANCGSNIAIVFSGWSGTNIRWFAVENVNVNPYGGYLSRGTGGPGPLRFQNITAVMKNCAANECSLGCTGAGIKLWGGQDGGVEVLDSIIDANYLAWGAAGTASLASYAIAADQCTQHWMIRNNYFKDHSLAIELQPDAGTGWCQSRPIDDMVIDRNLIENTVPSNHYVIQFRTTCGCGGGAQCPNPCGTLNTTVKSVTLTNNIFRNTVNSGKFEGFLYFAPDGNNQGDNPGVYTITGNTFYGYIPTGSLGLFYAPNDPWQFLQQHWVVKDNIFNPLSGAEITFGYAPTGYQGGGNVFLNGAMGNFRWGGTQQSFATWNSGQDGGTSKNCPPSFVNSVGGDLHLASTDTCARDAGQPINTTTIPSMAFDFDGQSRPYNTLWDIGADEVVSGPPDTTPPSVPTGVSLSSPTSTSFQATWTAATDNVAVAGYRLDVSTSPTFTSFLPSYNNVDVGNGTTKAIIGLLPSTTYYAKVKAYDAANNVSSDSLPAQGTTQVPDTTPPTISAVTSANITATGATITWTTNEAADAQVEYGLSTSYGSTSVLDTTLLTSHSVLVSGLTANTLYHYRVNSKDAAGNLALSGDFSLTTLSSSDTTPPIISAVSSGAITATGATITWTTNETASSQVDYGTTLSYGSASTLESTLVTSHNVVLSGLTPTTLYHYRVRSADAAGNSAIGTDQTLTTLVTPPPTSGLVAAWALDGNFTDAVDGHQGTINGASAWVPGRSGYGQALQFTPGAGGTQGWVTSTVGPPSMNDLAYCPTYPCSGPGASWTFWLYRPTATSCDLFYKSNTDNSGWEIGPVNDGSLALHFPVQGLNFRVGTAQGVLPITGWHHVAITATGDITDSTSVKVYVDGTEKPVTTTIGQSSNRISDANVRMCWGQIGSACASTGTTPTCDVTLDNVRIYNRVLTPTEIQTDMTTPVGGVLGDLDSNGTVDALDLQHLINVLLGLEMNPRADVDGDGSATVLDLQRLVNLLLGV